MPIIDWTHSGPAVTASFLASLVEFVEALTIVLAVGAVRGWRPAMIGTFAGVVLLAILVAGLGPALGLVPLKSFQLVVGILLLLFGMRWLRKAVLRTAGIIGLHDEDAIFLKEKKALEKEEAGIPAGASFDWIAIATTFKAVVLEGLEVVFIVIATGSNNHNLIPASIGAAAAGVLVIALGLLIHKPLSKVPENTLKFAVGVMLSSFGVFWVGEGLKFSWPGEDRSLIGLALAFLAVAYITAMVIKSGSKKMAVGEA